MSARGWRIGRPTAEPTNRLAPITAPPSEADQRLVGGLSSTGDRIAFSLLVWLQRPFAFDFVAAAGPNQLAEDYAV
jgi:hypothetical protein